MGLPELLEQDMVEFDRTSAARRSVPVGSRPRRALMSVDGAAPVGADGLSGEARRWLEPGRPVDLPARRRPRTVNTRGPASGLVPLAPGRVVASCVEPARVDTGYRMGRWSRLAATVAVTVSAVGILISVLSATPTVGTTEITVRSGDTLWSVARQITVQEDPYAVMQQIEDLNPGSQAVLLPGTLLTVPAAA